MNNEIEVLHKGKFIQLCKKGTWEFSDRLNCTGIVVVVAITNDNKIILVEQFRTAVNSNVIELPAGIVGDIDASELPETAAKRELFEETGYSAGKMTFLTSGPVSPGFSTESIDIFKATSLSKDGPGGGDDKEDIIIHEVEINDFSNWSKEQRKLGKLIDPKVYIGLFFNK